MMWSDCYVGLPFKHKGRDARGLDCWGLVRLVLAEQKGVALPAYDETDDVRAALAAAMQGGEWVSTHEPREFDGVSMLAPLRINGKIEMVEKHVGIMAGPRHVLHIDEGRSSVCLPLDHALIRHRLAGTWRHKSLVGSCP